MKNLSNSIFSPSSCRYWSRIYAWFAWFGLDSHVLPRCFSMQLSPTTWVSQLQREVQNIGFLKLCFFRCSSISWFQAVSGSVIYRFQLAHLRVFQIILYKFLLKFINKFAVQSTALALIKGANSATSAQASLINLCPSCPLWQLCIFRRKGFGLFLIGNDLHESIKLFFWWLAWSCFDFCAFDFELWIFWSCSSQPSRVQRLNLPLLMLLLFWSICLCN